MTVYGIVGNPKVLYCFEGTDHSNNYNLVRGATNSLLYTTQQTTIILLQYDRYHIWNKTYPSRTPGVIQSVEFVAYVCCLYGNVPSMEILNNMNFCKKPLVNSLIVHWYSNMIWFLRFMIRCGKESGKRRAELI